MVNSVMTIQSTKFSSFSAVTTRIRLEHKQDKSRVVSHISNGYLHYLIQ
jgi:hypothetical protein